MYLDIHPAGMLGSSSHTKLFCSIHLQNQQGKESSSSPLLKGGAFFEMCLSFFTQDIEPPIALWAEEETNEAQPPHPWPIHTYMLTPFLL